MKIETEKINEIYYDELIDEKQDIKDGDMLLIKEDKSDEWVAQFVTMITNVGIYLHPEEDGLDGGGVILWPENVKKQGRYEKAQLYKNDKFIHIPINRKT